jgi:carbon monoxide dehydrogenase subunit G
MALHFEGTQQIKAPIERVWQFVLDPNKVAECAPGFKSMEILADDHFKPTIAVGISLSTIPASMAAPNR